MFDAATQLAGDAFAGFFETLVVPAMYALGMGNLLEDAYTASMWLLAGVAQIVVIATVFGALQRWRPVEPVVDKSGVRLDFIYTLIHRLGVFQLALFFAIEPWWDELFSRMHLAGWPTWQLDAALAPLVPGLTDTAVFAFVAYLVAFDFFDYWIHRGQHGVQAWWALHALHHSQRQMTMWSDNRNHLIDSLIRDSLLVLVARFIGIAPGQFIAVVALTRLVESLAHANVRLSFGPVFERLLVSPRFHRLHHSIGLGHESRGSGSLGGHNFAVLFPVWDVIFGSANFEDRYDATGIRDQLPGQGERDYGKRFWRQQWLGLRRVFGRG